jgi:hypothetical protein
LAVGFALLAGLLLGLLAAAAGATAAADATAAAAGAALISAFVGDAVDILLEGLLVVALLGPLLACADLSSSKPAGQHKWWQHIAGWLWTVQVGSKRLLLEHGGDTCLST